MVYVRMRTVPRADHLPKDAGGAASSTHRAVKITFAPRADLLVPQFRRPGANWISDTKNDVAIVARPCADLVSN